MIIYLFTASNALKLKKIICDYGQTNTAKIYAEFLRNDFYDTRINRKIEIIHGIDSLKIQAVSSAILKQKDRFNDSVNYIIVN